MADVGSWALLLTLVVSVYAAVASIMGAQTQDRVWFKSARNAAFAAAGTATVASIILFALLIGRDYGVRYVYEHVDDRLPTTYTVSAFWAGQEGSLLLWLWLLTAITLLMVLLKQAGTDSSGPYVLATMALTQAFLAGVIILVSSPFELLSTVPAEGQGLNPLLRNPWMVMHPPVVFVGYAAYTAPFALVIGGLVNGQLDDDWLRAVRGWALLAWLFLGAGIVMGAWWAYLELGWGGYWGWDPVENASLIPWLIGTAVLHSLMMQQRRGVFKIWNTWLVSATFLLCVFATFITRSGVIQSVHAFGRSPIGIYLIVFVALCLAVLAALVSLRRQTLRGQYEFRELFTRETSLFLTNLLLVGTALTVFLGTLFPALVELIQGRQAALDASFYERTVGPAMLLIVGLIGVCPLVVWGSAATKRLRPALLVPAVAAVAAIVLAFLLGARQAIALLSFAICAFVGVSLLGIFYRGALSRHRRTEKPIPVAFLQTFWTNRPRYGAHIVHIGIVLLATGITGSSIYQNEVQFALEPGEQVDAAGYTLRYQDLISSELPDQQRFTAVVDVLKGNRHIATLRPEKDFYWNVEQWVTEVAIHSTIKEDLYLILVGSEADELASFRLLISPLVIWLWIGGAALLLGGVLAWWPGATERSRQ